MLDNCVSKSSSGSLSLNEEEGRRQYLWIGIVDVRPEVMEELKRARASGDLNEAPVNNDPRRKASAAAEDEGAAAAETDRLEGMVRVEWKRGLDYFHAPPCVFVGVVRLFCVHFLCDSCAEGGPARLPDAQPQ